jgi:hypothetical protein
MWLLRVRLRVRLWRLSTMTGLIGPGELGYIRVPRYETTISTPLRIFLLSGPPPTKG